MGGIDASNFYLTTVIGRSWLFTRAPLVRTDVNARAMHSNELDALSLIGLGGACVM